jgi:hypothetical protein
MDIWQQRVPKILSLLSFPILQDNKTKKPDERIVRLLSLR